MRPIPKKYLCHTATVIDPDITNGWDFLSPSDTEMLTKIRIEPSSARILGKDNTEIKLAGVLFYDCRNSRPKNFNFAEGQRVFYGGEFFTVVSIEPLFSGRRLHHYEIGMI